MKDLTSTALLLWLAVGSVACVTTAQEGEQMRKDIADLRTELKKEVDTAGMERDKLAAEQGQTQKSRELFEEFLQKFPKDELAPNAQYWLGESYYAEKKWNDAIVEFQKVLKDHKGSEKVPDALVKIGMCFQAQGDCQNAMLFYEEVQQSHKSSASAKTARERAGECRKKKK